MRAVKRETGEGRGRRRRGGPCGGGVIVAIAAAVAAGPWGFALGQGAAEPPPAPRTPPAAAAEAEVAEAEVAEAEVVEAPTAEAPPAEASPPPPAAPRLRASLVVTDEELHDVSPLLFGQFLEDAGLPSRGDPGPEAALIPGTDRLRPDAVAALRELHAPIVRYPGGYLVERIGERFDYRVWLPRPIDAWNERWGLTPVDASLRRAFGLVQFLELCRELGSEPLVVVPARPAITGEWSVEQTASFAAGLVAMANVARPADAPPELRPWVEARVDAGLVPPAHARYWQIGNELWVVRNRHRERLGWDETQWLDRQFAVVTAIAEAMKAVDPSLELITDAMNPDYNRRVEADAPRIDMLSDHRYVPWAAKSIERDGEAVPVESLTAEQHWNVLVSTPHVDDAGRSLWEHHRGNDAHGLDHAYTEWNWNGWGRNVNGHPTHRPEWAQAVGAAGFLHAIMRRGDRARLATQSMMLGSRWDITAVRVDPGHGAFVKPTGRVTAFYSRHHGHRRLAVDDAGVPRFAQPFRMRGIRAADAVATIDALATRDADTLFVHLIHRGYATPADLAVDLAAHAIDPDRPATLRLLLGRSDVDVGRPELATLVREVAVPVSIEGGVAELDLPPQSIAVLEAPLARASHADPEPPDANQAPDANPGLPAPAAPPPPTTGDAP